ncbi:hypothetical protein [Hymenobacter rubidus]|uniref:hypothetical protein n=1 Tax=Hymenobacter rubidus TaxID=1441626 RepID=UPI00191CEC3E|nr:hypothetical protein [Hymenobacter rubidus]
MSKNKPKGSKKSRASNDLLDAATVGLQKFRRFAKQVNKLSTTQKLVGGLAALAAGYALITNTSPAETSTEVPALDEPASLAEAPPTTPVAPARTPKPKRAKPASHVKYVPFSQEHS